MRSPTLDFICGSWYDVYQGDGNDADRRGMHIVTAHPASQQRGCVHNHACVPIVRAWLKLMPSMCCWVVRVSSLTADGSRWVQLYATSGIHESIFSKAGDDVVMTTAISRCPSHVKKAHFPSNNSTLSSPFNYGQKESLQTKATSSLLQDVHVFAWERRGSSQQILHHYSIPQQW